MTRAWTIACVLVLVVGCSESDPVADGTLGVDWRTVTFCPLEGEVCAASDIVEFAPASVGGTSTVTARRTIGSSVRRFGTGGCADITFARHAHRGHRGSSGMG